MTAILVLTKAALPVAQKLAEALPGARLHALKGRIDGLSDVVFEQTTSHIRHLFQQGEAIIGVVAAGILIRALAPVLSDKQSEPPVLAVSSSGDAVVPLLGGHHGGNALAAQVAEILGVRAAITTGGDTVLGVSLDEPPHGWRVADPTAIKPVAAHVLAGGAVRLDVEAGDADWLAHLPQDPQSSVTIGVGPRTGDGMRYVPPVLALGVGCERGVAPQVLVEAVRSALDQAGLDARAVACVASVDVKADEAAVLQVANHLGVPARFFTAAALEAETPRLATPSDVVFAEIGCHGVAEAAALAAAGPQSRLIVPKIKGDRVTVAIAQSLTDIRADAVGRARGRLLVMGIGPGADYWRTPQVDAALAEVTDLVGYGLYLDLLGKAADGKIRHMSALGEEAARARMALNLAGEGKTVALVCSGDPGIYALATLVFELLEREEQPTWRRIEVAVMPGISALQAAAARAGAPVNHDFCTISLSDLLTPWPTIERRLRAAAEGDFVVCFYNPVSQRRRDQLARAREILLTGRPASTPVILARNLGRDGETVTVVELGALTPDMADMLTLVMVGNSETRRIEHAGKTRVYTPRGYGKILT